ncbi:MAG: DUF1353 domain-containing protein [Pirellulales bacterium]
MMVETVMTGPARKMLRQRIRIEYELGSLLSPIGVYVDDLKRENYITLVPITFRIGRHTEVIPAGYVFDGASIPRIFWGLKGFSPVGAKLWAALIHDWFCDEWAKFEVAWDFAATDEERANLLDAAPLSLTMADAAFVSVLLDTGEETWRAIVMYLAVRAHHTWPRASALAGSAIRYAAAGGVGSCVTAGVWWILKNLIL